MKRTIPMILILFCLVVACGEDDLLKYSNDDCDAEIADVRNTMGPEEELNKYDTSDYHSWDLWYWSQGICYGFTWGKFVDGCEMSTYTFDPIDD